MKFIKTVLLTICALLSLQASAALAPRATVMPEDNAKNIKEAMAYPAAAFAATCAGSKEKEKEKENKEGAAKRAALTVAQLQAHIETASKDLLSIEKALFARNDSMGSALLLYDRFMKEHALLVDKASAEVTPLIVTAKNKVKQKIGQKATTLIMHHVKASCEKLQKLEPEGFSEGMLFYMAVENLKDAVVLARNPLVAQFIRDNGMTNEVDMAKKLVASAIETQEEFLQKFVQTNRGDKRTGRDSTLNIKLLEDMAQHWETILQGLYQTGLAQPKAGSPVKSPKTVKSPISFADEEKLYNEQTIDTLNPLIRASMHAQCCLCMDHYKPDFLKTLIPLRDSMIKLLIEAGLGDLVPDMSLPDAIRNNVIPYFKRGHIDIKLAKQVEKNLVQQCTQQIINICDCLESNKENKETCDEATKKEIAQQNAILFKNMGNQYCALLRDTLLALECQAEAPLAALEKRGPLTAQDIANYMLSVEQISDLPALFIPELDTRSPEMSSLVDTLKKAHIETDTCYRQPGIGAEDPAALAALMASAGTLRELCPETVNGIIALLPEIPEQEEEKEEEEVL